MCIFEGVKTIGWALDQYGSKGMQVRFAVKNWGGDKNWGLTDNGTKSSYRLETGHTVKRENIGNFTASQTVVYKLTW